MSTDRFNRDNRERWAAYMQSLHPDIDPRAARLLDEFRVVAHQVYQLSETALEPSGLSYAQYRVLMSLRFCEWAGDCAGLNPSEISANQGTGRNTISALIRSLEAAELIERRLDNEDRRRFNIHLTDAGRKMVADQAERHVGLIDQLFTALSDEEMETLSTLLQTLSRRVRELKGQ